jgi:Putative zinc-finger
MKCEELKFNLSLYSDDILTNDEREVLEIHLAQCPLCRQKLADMQEIRNNLRVLARPAMPMHILNSVKFAVAAELEAVNPSPQFFVFNETFGEWIQKRLVAFGIGAFASVALGMMLLWSLMSSVNNVQPNNEFAGSRTFPDKTVLLANADPKNSGDNFDLTPSQFAATRVSVAGESPSINPQGALIALTKSLMRGEMKDEEVVIVADVFGDGLARINEVVEPKKNIHAVYELEKALKTDSIYAPFVPANMDQRSDSVRVILKFQSVDVKTNLGKRKK